MDISEKEAAVLRQMLGFRDVPPTTVTYLRQAWRGHLVLISLCAFGAGLFSAGGWWPMAGVLVGAGFASIARDLAWIRALVRTWPLNREVIDWARVEALLGQRHKM